MAKRTIVEAFDDYFTRELKAVRRNEDAYDRATEKFEREHKFTAFNSYDSFRLKKKRKSG
jgi:hypothetical protein